MAFRVGGVDKLFKRFLLSSRVSWGPLESSWSPLASFFFLLGYPGRFLGALLRTRGSLWVPFGGLWRSEATLGAHVALLGALGISLGGLCALLAPLWSVFTALLPVTSHKPTNCPPHTQEFKLDVRSPHASPKMTAGQGREGINLLFIFFPL